MTDFIRHDVIQQSIGWHWLRAGKVGSSTLKDLMGTKLAQQRLFQAVLEGSANRGPRPPQGQWDSSAVEDLNTAPIRWGRRHETGAIGNVELELGIDIEPGPVLSRPDIRLLLVSLDGITETVEPVEVKCPYNPGIHIKTVANGMPKEHMAQLQSGMIITGASRGLFVSYDPREPDHDLYHEWVPRDEEYCAEAIHRLQRMADGLRTGEYIPKPKFRSFSFDASTSEVPELF